jgi:pimeloyl-ACP methyl ester carboxylesterase
MNVVMIRPDLVRSWVTDVIGIYDPEYVWHDLAQVWQQPGAGEQLVDTMMTAPARKRVERYVGLGLTREVAEDIATGHGAEMGRCILALYRSAAQPVLRELGERLPAAAARPGLAVLATEDHYVGTDEMRRRAAARAGAQLAVLDGLGHWWMVQDPARGARLLTDFWSSVS